MNDADLFERFEFSSGDRPLLEFAGAAARADYIGFAAGLVQGIPSELEHCEPIERVVELMRLGDKFVLDDDLAGIADCCFNQVFSYALAVESLMDPLVQLELGCLLLQRAGTDESPLCEHMYEGDNYYDWQPATELHHDVGPGPLSPNREEVLRVALRAYGNAWDFYKFSRNGAHAFVRSLFALDGIRVCYENLEDTERAWMLCNGLKKWIHGDYWEYEIGHWDGDFDEIVAEVRERFARTKGRMEPVMLGRIRALKVLEKELPWFDLVGEQVRNYLADAEYMRLMLRDPTYNPKAIVATYTTAVEAMLRQRVGYPMDKYLEVAPKAERATFEAEFLKSRGGQQWRCQDLTLSQFARNLRKGAFRRVLSKAGADTPFYFQELPKALQTLLKYRDPASHADEVLFTEEGVMELRSTVLHVLQKLASIKVILSAE